jgi:DNA-binding beta-propeller fold protein YncE
MKRIRTTIALILSLLASRPLTAAEPLVRTATIPLKGVTGKLDHLAVDSKNQRLFVANKPNNTLDIVDLKTGTLVKQVPDQGKISGVAYASDLDMIYVGNGVGVCNAFDGKDYHQVFSTPAPNADNVHFHSGNKKVYVGQDEVLSELDATTGQVTATIALPGAVHGFKLDKQAGTIFAVLTKQSLIGVISIDKHQVVETFPLTLSDAGSPIAQDAENGLLFVGCPKAKPKVVVFDSKTGREVASVDIPAGVDDVHFDSKRKRLYASCSAQALVVVEKVGDGFKVTNELRTPKDSRTCAWSQGKLYLGVPKSESTEGPEVWVYEAPPLESQ